MAPCGVLPMLPTELPQWKVEAAMQELIRNKVESDQVFRDCVLKHSALVEYIDHPQ